MLSSCRVADNIAGSKMSVGGSIVEKKKKTLKSQTANNEFTRGPQATHVVAKLRVLRGGRIILKAVYDDKKSLFV